MTWKEEIAKLAPQVVTMLGDHDPVAVIYINKTGSVSERHLIERWEIPGVTRVHQGAWPLMLDLLEEGWVSEQAVGRLWVTLTTLEQSEDRLLLNAYEAYKAGYIDLETFEAYHIDNKQSVQVKEV